MNLSLNVFFICWFSFFGFDLMRCIKEFAFTFGAFVFLICVFSIICCDGWLFVATLGTALSYSSI